MSLELTILMPCLNEANTVTRCVAKAKAFLLRSGIQGEVVVADNGSTDGSQRLADLAGARVIDVPQKGYGAALIAGIKAADGKHIIMGDADDSYDFENLEPFVEKLRNGASLVMGNRFAGGIADGAMPALHRYLGTPVISFIGRLFFRLKIRDFNCGLRGFVREDMLRLNLNSTGMEFASELIVKSALANLPIAEVPTSLKKDGRGRRPHLRSWRDGWRHLRFLLMLSPRWLFLIPGAAFWLVGTMLCCALAFGPLTLSHVVLDIHTMLYAGSTSIVGMQMIYFALFTKLLGTSHGAFKASTATDLFVRHFSLEKGLAVSGALMSAGLTLAIISVMQWQTTGFSAMDPERLMRFAIPATTLIIQGVETAMAAFFISILDLLKKNTTYHELANQR